MATDPQLSGRPFETGDTRIYNPATDVPGIRRRFTRAMIDLAEGSPGAHTREQAGGRCFYCGLAGCDLEAAELGPLHSDPCLALVRDSDRAELLARVLWGLALRGKEWAAKLVAARLWPERLEITAPPSEERAGETAADRMAELPPDLAASFARGVAGLLQSGATPEAGPSSGALEAGPGIEPDQADAAELADASELGEAPAPSDRERPA